MSRSRSARNAPRQRASANERQPLFGPAPSTPSALLEAATPPVKSELFVWFEDTRSRGVDGKRGLSGFPECLLPYGSGIRVLDRRYAEGHLHLLAAARLRCDERLAECVSTIYTTALALGTIAWIGTGEQYRRAWTQMYPRGSTAAAVSRDDSST